jgi:hypothetical protein
VTALLSEISSPAFDKGWDLTQLGLFQSYFGYFGIDAIRWIGQSSMECRPGTLLHQTPDFMSRLQLIKTFTDRL